VQRTLAEQMIDYWSSFVTDGVPSVEGLPGWPQMNPQEPQRMSLEPGTPALTTDFVARHQCGFWDSLG